MKKNLTLFFCLGLFQLQANTIDSLYQAIKSEQELAKLPTLVQQYEQLANDSEGWAALAKGYFLLGYKYNLVGKIDKAYRYYLETIRFAEQAEDVLRIVKTQINLGTMHIESFEYDIAEGFYQQALENAIILENKLFMALTNKDIGLSLRKRQKQDEAMQYYYDALRLYKDLDNHQMAAEMYIEIGLCFKEVGLYNDASSYYNKALAECTESDDIKVRVFNNDAHIKWIQGDSVNAIKQATQGIEINRKLNSKILLVPSLNNLGMFYFESGALHKALPLFVEAFNINNEQEYSGKMAQELHETITYLELIEAEIGPSYLLADLGVHKKTRELNLKLLERMITLEPMGKQAELRWIREQNEREILETSYRKYYLVGTSIAILILAGIVIFFKRREKRSQEQRKALLRVATQKINRIFS